MIPSTAKSDRQIEPDVHRESRWVGQTETGVAADGGVNAVEPPGGIERSDIEIARAVRRAFEWDEFVPRATIRSTVSRGWVTLEGTVPVLQQKEYAERVVRLLSGVKGIHNRLGIAPSNVDSDGSRTPSDNAPGIPGVRGASIERNRWRTGKEIR